MSEPKTIVSTQIPADWDETLKQEADRLDVTKSTIIREVIGEKVEEIRTQPEINNEQA